MARTKKRALFLDTEASFAINPNGAGDGTGMRWVPTMELGPLVDGKAPLRTDYFTGRNFNTAPIPGPDGGSFDMKMPLFGLAAAAGDGASVGADDVLDEILLHIFGTQANVVGEGLNSGSTTSSIVLDTSTGALQDLMAIFEANVPSAANGGQRTQWCKKIDVSGAPTYTVAPTLVQAPTTAAIAYGIKQYRPDDDGGATLAMVYREDELDYTLLGVRCTRAVIEWEAGKIITLALSWSFDNKTQETLTNLPVVGAAPPATPLRALSSPLWFNNTRYPIQKGSLDLGVTAAEIGATEGVNGRGGFDSISLLPKLTVNPLRTDAIQNLKRNVTTGRLLLQLGGGVLASSVLDTMCFESEQASVMDAPIEDENGRQRNSVNLEVTDQVVFTGSTLAHAFQLARA